jgi:hypothetical protein
MMQGMLGNKRPNLPATNLNNSREYGKETYNVGFYGHQYKHQGNILIKK